MPRRSGGVSEGKQWTFPHANVILSLVCGLMLLLPHMVDSRSQSSSHPTAQERLRLLCLCL